MRIRWRPKSSITSVPQLLFNCSGASLMPVDGVVGHFELRHGQFAAGDDRGPADANPALVDLPRVEQSRALFQRRLLVVHGIVEADDLAVDADRAGNPNLAAEGGRDPLGDARLAVARRAEEKQSPAGIDGRPEPIEHLPAQQQALERAVQVVRRGMLVGERLGVDAGDVVVQRDGRRAEVGAVLRIPPPPLPAQIAELILEVVHRGRPAMDDESGRSSCRAAAGRPARRAA